MEDIKLTISEWGDIILSLNYVQNMYEDEGRRRGFEHRTATAKRFQVILDRIYEQRTDIDKSWSSPEYRTSKKAPLL